MKKIKQLPTNYSLGNVDTVKLSRKVGSLLENAIPKTVLGMLSLAEDKENGLLFYKRWMLLPKEKHNYSVYDTWAKEEVYQNISLLISALHIIYHLNKPVLTSNFTDQQIYNVDQEYFRCLENIKFFKAKIASKDAERSLLFASRLQNSYYRLDEIKTRLSKIY